ncbi:hypothetical protein [Microvirga arabica]|nr:hypothetical protein [Microvirga arabica]MBM1173645.1 hypothetical protein [Microvirga arabica]
MADDMKFQTAAVLSNAFREGSRLETPFLTEGDDPSEALARRQTHN